MSSVSRLIHSHRREKARLASRASRGPKHKRPFLDDDGEHERYEGYEDYTEYDDDDYDDYDDDEFDSYAGIDRDY
jgi:hypothetical protein